MSELRGTATARVTVTLEIPVGSWGPDCSLEQIVNQATKDATARALQGCTHFSRVIGTPEVTVGFAKVQG